jgi:hypothetical protein
MKTKNTYNFNGGWSVGEMKRQITIKNAEKVIPSKKVYSRKDKFKLKLWD